MRLILFLICTWTLQCQHLAHAQTPTNLAYTDDFVWYASGRLAYQHMAVQRLFGGKFDEASTAEIRMQLNILYHHYLVKCDGPLPQIAEALAHFDIQIQTERRNASALQYVGQMDYQIWPIIEKWHVKTLDQIMNAYISGSYGFFPDCVIREYREHNPIPGAEKESPGG